MFPACLVQPTGLFEQDHVGASGRGQLGLRVKRSGGRVRIALLPSPWWDCCSLKQPGQWGGGGGSGSISSGGTRVCRIVAVFKGWSYHGSVCWQGLPIQEADPLEMRPSSQKPSMQPWELEILIAQNGDWGQTESIREANVHTLQGNIPTVWEPIDQITTNYNRAFWTVLSKIGDMYGRQKSEFQRRSNKDSCCF